MKIRTRLICLLMFISLIFFGLFIAQRIAERRRLIELWNSVRIERENIFDKIIELQGRSLQTFVTDYTFWDDMVKFAASPSAEWAQENIAGSMDTYAADVAWVYNKEKKLVYSNVRNEENAELKEYYLPKEALDKLFLQSPFCNFFINVAGKLVEVKGATIHPSADNKRETPSQGYFFVCRLWTQGHLDEISHLTNSRVILSDTPIAQAADLNQSSAIDFSRILADWDNQPVKYLLISSVSEAITNAKRSIFQVAVLFLSFSIAAALVVSFFIFHWVNVPLQLISRALEKENSSFLTKIKRQATEFGEVSRMVDSFFVQRKILLDEISLRKQTQNALDKVNNCFISFGVDPNKNIQLITNTAGEILEAVCTLYNHNQGGILQTQASWHEPPDFSRSGPGQGHICFDLITAQKNQLIVIDDLQHTSYAQTDPNVKKYNLQSYVGCPIRVQGKTVASLCAVFTSGIKLDSYHFNLLQVLGKAASIEEERKHMEDIFKQQAGKLDEALKEALKSREVLLSMLEDNQLNKIKLEASVVELGQAYSRLKESQEEVIRSAKFGAIGQLASSVAHEVRNPLAIIMQSIDYLGDKVSGQHREVLQLAANNIRRANTIVATLLDFSKVKELKMEPEDINSILDDSLKLTHYSNLKDKVKVFRELGNGLPKVLVDRQKIEQVFVNLLLNAMQAMPEGGNLLVRTYQAEFHDLSEAAKSSIQFEGEEIKNVIVTEVKDEGVGISEENMKNIFRPFFTTKGAMTGIGLGLSVVKDIIALHRGYVGIESKFGKGTKVSILFRAI
jgi:signal transduction histidine kinase